MIFNRILRFFTTKVATIIYQFSVCVENYFLYPILKLKKVFRSYVHDISRMRSHFDFEDRTFTGFSYASASGGEALTGIVADTDVPVANRETSQCERIIAGRSPKGVVGSKLVRGGTGG
jgi:hypothetical protein